MHANRSIKSLRPVAAAVLSLGVLASGHAVAGEDDTPLSLTLSQTVNRDSNFGRNDQRIVPETVFNTSGNLKLDKQYGRQNYHAGLQLSKLQYHNNPQLDNDAKNFDGSFSTEIAQNWLVSANGLYSEALNPIENNSAVDRVQKNIRKYRDGGFSVQYGNGGTWAIAGSFDKNKQTYSADSQSWQDADQKTVGAKAIYFATDLLRYSLGMRRVVTQYPGYPDRISYGQVVDRNIDASIDWQITGLSKLSATLTRRSTSYTPDTIAGSKGWTGEAGWIYTPRGIVSYDFGFSRTTGTDRSIGGANVVYTGSNPDIQNALQNRAIAVTGAKINNDTITTSISAGARAQLTGKINVSYTYSLTNFKVDRSIDLTRSDYQAVPSAAPNSSYNHQNVVSLYYAAMRTLGFGCSYHTYSQGEDIYRVYRYHGRSFDCNASFTLDTL